LRRADRIEHKIVCQGKFESLFRFDLDHFYSWIFSEYIEEYECTTTQFETVLKGDIFKSFPSGHAAVVSYVSIFLIWYLNKRLRNFGSTLVQIVIGVSTVYCSISRLLDRRHFWWDVLGGNLIAISTVSYAVSP
jgi:membrane-associated phospholipid phosphatase